MLKRVHIKGYKSLEDVEIEVSPLTVLFGPNAAGKSNFLDAMQLLSRLATSHTIRDAFAPPYRGKPLESFSFGKSGLKGLASKKHLRFSIEADFCLSDAVASQMHYQMQIMERQNGNGDDDLDSGDGAPEMTLERDLRYRIEITMVPKSGIMRVTDEFLAPVDWRDTENKSPYICLEKDQGGIRAADGGSYFQVSNPESSALSSMPPPLYLPHLTAARAEMGSWRFHYLDPRDSMRTANPVSDVRHIGYKGEKLAVFLNTLKALDPKQYEVIEKALGVIIPDIEGIKVDVNKLGDVDLYLIERGVEASDRIVSEGTLRILGLLTLAGARSAPSLVGLEEPENGVHPRRIEIIAELLKTQMLLGRSQYIVTTHSPRLLDLLPPESLRVVRRVEGRTHIDLFSAWGPIRKKQAIDQGLEEQHEALPVSERILRGDFDA